MFKKTSTPRLLTLLAAALAVPACGGQGGGSSLPGEPLWSVHNPQNVPITTSVSQSLTQMISDGAGGAIVAWVDFRTGGSNADVYAQRVDATGVVRWTIDGLGIATGAWSEFYFRIAADGAGGAILVWEDERSGTSVDLYAQRVSADGIVLWIPGGKAVTTAAGNETGPDIVSDGAGGAIIAWTDNRGADPDIYAQRVNGSGDSLWTANGIPITTATGGQGSPQLVESGDGGAVAVWPDSRNGTDIDLYAQRIDASGAPKWTTNGVPLSSTTGDQRSHRVVSDGSGGVIVAWEDTRNGSYTDIYAGRVTGAGTVPWTANGVALATAPGYQETPRIASDGAGGAIVAWMDENGGPGVAKVYAQRLDPSGTPLWTAGGNPVSTFLGRQSGPDVISDDAGGAVIAWTDLRNGTADIYTQRMNASGLVLWGNDGVGACTVTLCSQSGVLLAPNGFGGAVLAWSDTRPNGSFSKIYAQGVSSSGQP